MIAKDIFKLIQSFLLQIKLDNFDKIKTTSSFIHAVKPTGLLSISKDTIPHRRS